MRDLPRDEQNDKKLAKFVGALISLLKNNNPTALRQTETHDDKKTKLITESAKIFKILKERGDSREQDIE